jgi:hypothetical protein
MHFYSVFENILSRQKEIKERVMAPHKTLILIKEQNRKIFSLMENASLVSGGNH